MESVGDVERFWKAVEKVAESRPGEDPVAAELRRHMEEHRADSRRILEDGRPRPALAADPVEHPPHYTSSPAGCSQCGHPIECIDVVEHMGFCLGNAVKYIWRCDLKRDAIEDLRKSIWYIQREIERRTNGDDNA